MIDSDDDDDYIVTVTVMVSLTLFDDHMNEQVSGAVNLSVHIKLNHLSTHTHSRSSVHLTFTTFLVLFALAASGGFACSQWTPKWQFAFDCSFPYTPFLSFNQRCQSIKEILIN